MNYKKSGNQESFSNYSLKVEILKSIGELGFTYPTPIQQKVIPHLMSSTKDMIASAQTGTGKTAAFGLPLLNLTELKNKNREFCLTSIERVVGNGILRKCPSYSDRYPALSSAPVVAKLSRTK